MAEEVFAEELPWLKWLPAEARSECVTELLDHLLAGAETGLLVPFARVLREWMSTAEIYRNAGQCSGVHAGGEGPRGSALWGASVPER
ncbi:hypothetical protein [Sphaerimonospora thailandensis]|uniref:Uncharacterized protein n=1 Tax=Sphaerimonospora thailandensis TaxID=795644 RepID=A0A8J3RCM4_9ACTN|nr:hypothetical protein [Sphaerimonospora thailandensis]GIH71364.1 hypothetical protein Mth01_36170 [Sphaerimonospora thailandensis]